MQTTGIVTIGNMTANDACCNSGVLTGSPRRLMLIDTPTLPSLIPVQGHSILSGRVPFRTMYICKQPTEQYAVK